jgi:hypothetical protein
MFAEEAPSRSRPLWVSGAVAAALLAILVGTPALAVGLGVIDFGSAEPAPPRVVKQFESLSTGAPPGMDPGVVAGEARQVRVAGRVLWVAPTRAGGLCYGWDGTSGGCEKLGTAPLSVSWLGRPTRVPPSLTRPSIYSVEGFARIRWVDTVEVRLDDGTAVRPELTWISEPIGAGFFHYTAPRDRAVVAVVGFRNGDEVIGEELDKRDEPHPYARLDERTKLAEIETPVGAVQLWTAPTKTDGRCVWLEHRGEERAVAPCLPRGYDHEPGLAIALHEFGGAPILAGRCGYASVELVRPDGSSRRVGCRYGVAFARLDSAELQGTLQAVNASGKPLRGSRIQVARLRR